MAKSFIGLAEDNKVRGIYVSWEPYNRNTAQILLEHYQYLPKIKELIFLGNILYLEKEIKDIQKPLGDTTEEIFFQSISSAIKNSWNFEHAEYCYIYNNGSWLGFSSNVEEPKKSTQRMEEIPDPPNSCQSDYSYIYDSFLKG